MDSLSPLPRRQGGGSGSARSLLLTVLGEFVLPADGAAVDLGPAARRLGGLGLEEKSARQALARLAAGGWITAHRAGRRVRWALTPPGHELLAEGAARIYSFGRDAPAWDGRWLVLLVTVPETRRQLRHKLRTRLTWAGFGSPLPGVWVSPHPAREAEAKQVTEQLGLDGGDLLLHRPVRRDRRRSARWSSRPGTWAIWPPGTRRSWPVSTDLRPPPGDDTLLAQVRLVDEWRRFPLADPRPAPGAAPARLDRGPGGRRLRRPAPRLGGAARARWAELSAAAVAGAAVRSGRTRSQAAGR